MVPVFRPTNEVVLAFLLLLVAGCSTGSAPSEGSCNGYDRPLVVQSSACDADVLVTTTPACDSSKPPTSITRTDCAAVGDVCRGATCVHVCNTNADCEIGQFCPIVSKSFVGRNSCFPAGNYNGPCELSNSRSCTGGLTCLLEHWSATPSDESAACLTTCDTTQDCGTSKYCSTIDLTHDGKKTCQSSGKNCDPSNPQSCFPMTTCQALGLRGTRGEYVCM
jgi:hypothetical protein